MNKAFDFRIDLDNNEIVISHPDFQTQRVSLVSRHKSASRQKTPRSELANQMRADVERDNLRITMHMIDRISKGMLTDDSGLLIKSRADQVFGMLELAEVLNANGELVKFLESHHAEILKGMEH
ncbi:MAG: hypothetical protein JNM52_11415 [Betaproteobacteria bacterium]|nr:hypothetical protein [Betaproteobacteria bacterium]